MKMLDNIFETFNDPAAEESFGPDSETYRVHAFVAYLIPILFFVPFITNKYSDYCKFHSNQCLAWMIGVFALNIIKTILAHIPVLGGILNLVITLAMLAAWIILLIGVWRGKALKIPFLGDLIQAFK